MFTFLQAAILANGSVDLALLLVFARRATLFD
jgi:hypothetical protein